jgi:hypothetical protein
MSQRANCLLMSRALVVRAADKAWLKVKKRKLRSEIAAKQGRVLASAGLGNGPGVDALRRFTPQNAGIGATLSIQNF